MRYPIDIENAEVILAIVDPYFYYNHMNSSNEINPTNVQAV